MKSSNVFEPVWKTYSDTIYCLDITTKCVQQSSNPVIRKSSFSSLSDDATEAIIGGSVANVRELAIVSLWAIFERELMNYLQLEGQKLLQYPPNLFNTRVHQKIENDIEYWRSGDVLDLYKSVVDSNLIGKAKQVKRYRDWIVHKNPKNFSDNAVSPERAYQTLGEIISTVEQRLAIL